MSRFACLVIGFITGAIGALISLPAPIHPDHCTVNKVAQKAVTAFVLKPPVLDQAKCEVFAPTPIVQKPVEEPKVEKVEETVDEEKPRRRRWRHMRRHRRYY